MINVAVLEKKRYKLDADLALEVVSGGLSEEGLTEISDFIQLSKLQKLDVDAPKIIENLLKSTNLSPYDVAKTLGVSETFVLTFVKKSLVGIR
jgi:predicted DNA-binding ArsR family transcriptional regulator